MRSGASMASGMACAGTGEISCGGATIDYEQFLRPKTAEVISASKKKTLQTKSEFTKFITHTTISSNRPLNRFPESFVPFSSDATEHIGCNARSSSNAAYATPPEAVLEILPSDGSSGGNGIVYHSSGLPGKLSDYDDIWPSSSSSSSLDISAVEVISGPNLRGVQDPLYQNVNHQQIGQVAGAVDPAKYQLDTAKLDDKKVEPKSNCSSSFPIYRYTIDCKLKSQNIDCKMQLHNTSSNSTACKIQSQNINSNSTACKMQNQNIDSKSTACKIQSQNIDSKSIACKMQNQNIDSKSTACKIQSQNIDSNSTTCKMQSQNIDSNSTTCKMQSKNIDSDSTSLSNVISEHVSNGWRPDAKQQTPPSVFQFEEQSTCTTFENVSIRSQTFKRRQSHNDSPATAALIGRLPVSDYALPFDSVFSKVENSKSSIKAIAGLKVFRDVNSLPPLPHPPPPSPPPPSPSPPPPPPSLPVSHSDPSFPLPAAISSQSSSRRCDASSSGKRCFFIPKFLKKTNVLKYSPPIEDKNAGDEAPAMMSRTRESEFVGRSESHQGPVDISSCHYLISMTDDEYKQYLDAALHLRTTCVPSPVYSSSSSSIGHSDVGCMSSRLSRHHRRLEGNEENVRRGCAEATAVTAAAAAAAAESESVFLRKERKSKVRSKSIRQSISEMGRKVFRRRSSVRRSRTTQQRSIGGVHHGPTEPKSVNYSRRDDDDDALNENSTELILEIPSIDVVTIDETSTKTAEEEEEDLSRSSPFPQQPASNHLDLSSSERRPRRNSSYENVVDDESTSWSPDRSLERRRTTASSRATNVSAARQYCQPWDLAARTWSRRFVVDSADSVDHDVVVDVSWKQHEKFPCVARPHPPCTIHHDRCNSSVRPNDQINSPVTSNGSDNDSVRAEVAGAESARAPAVEGVTGDRDKTTERNYFDICRGNPIDSSSDKTAATMHSRVNDDPVLCESRCSDAKIDAQNEFHGTRYNVNSSSSSYSSKIIDFSRKIQTIRTEYENTYDWSASAAAEASGTFVSSAASQERSGDAQYVLQSSPDVIPLTTGPRLICQTNRRHDLTGSRICYHVVGLSKKPELFFANVVRNFIDCTTTGGERNPQMVLRNVRQFMDGMKNYLTHGGEDQLNDFIETECFRLKSFEFLNLDVILERALQKCVVKPLHEHIYKLFVYDYTRNGNLEKMSQSLKLAKSQTADMLQQLVSPTDGAIVSALHFLNLMEKTYSPLKKLENLLAAVQSLSPAFHHVRALPYDDTLNSDEKAANLKADELLPALVYALTEKGFLSAEIETDYMWGLIQGTFLTGEYSYHLNLFSSTVALIKTFRRKLEMIKNDSNGNDDSNSNNNIVKVLFNDGLLRVVVPDEKYDRAILVDVPVHPRITSREICNMMAYILGITNPQDYGLFSVNAEVETRLGDSRSGLFPSIPLVCDREHGRKDARQFMYKRIGAKFVWPKDNRLT